MMCVVDIPDPHYKTLLCPISAQHGQVEARVSMSNYKRRKCLPVPQQLSESEWAVGVRLRCAGPPESRLLRDLCNCGPWQGVLSSLICGW